MKDIMKEIGHSKICFIYGSYVFSLNQDVSYNGQTHLDHILRIPPYCMNITISFINP